MEHCQYRGYQIEPRREWMNWCVSVYRTRSDLPISPQPTLHTSTSRKDDAVAEAKQSIDRILSNLDSLFTAGSEAGPRLHSAEGRRRRESISSPRLAS
jgi:hypothetical protein